MSEFENCISKLIQLKSPELPRECIWIVAVDLFFQSDIPCWCPSLPMFSLNSNRVSVLTAQRSHPAF